MTIDNDHSMLAAQCTHIHQVRLNFIVAIILDPDIINLELSVQYILNVGLCRVVKLNFFNRSSFCHN